MPQPRAPRLVEVHGPALRLARKAAGLSLRRLSTAVGIDFSRLAKIERGELGRVRPQVFDAMVVALGCDHTTIMVHPRAARPAA